MEKFQMVKLSLWWQTMKNRFYLFTGLSAALLSASSVYAAEVDTNMAQMQAMDKITGKVNVIEVPVGGEVKFGSFSVVVRSCKTNSEDEIPENFAFVDVTDKSFDKDEFNIFKGWMFSSSPALNAVEHPIYDVWLLKCFNGEPKPEQLLSEEALAARDNLPRLADVREQQKQLQENSFAKAEPENNTIEFKFIIFVWCKFIIRITCNMVCMMLIILCLKIAECTDSKIGQVLFLTAVLIIPCIYLTLCHVLLFFVR